MASKQLFSRTSSLATDTINEAGGYAYSFAPEHALAQYAVTGTLNNTFYASAGNQLEKTLEMAKAVSTEFLVRLAIYARKKGLMKDMPALLLAIAASRPDANAFVTKQSFLTVCDDAKMLKNFVQIIRSGKAGRKSFGSMLKRYVQSWFDSKTEEQLFNASVGGDPSLLDLINLFHPKPTTKTREAFYGYITNSKPKPDAYELLPRFVRDYVEFRNAKKNGSPIGEIPNVPFMLLTNLKLTTEEYTTVAMRMSWSALRQNLNVLAKNDVFKSDAVTAVLAKKLADPNEVRRAKALPFQLLSSFKATHGNKGIPPAISNALQDALDASLANVPELSGKVIVALDISGSMTSNLTDKRGTTTCLDAAALFASALLRRNPNNVRIIPFSDNVVPVTLNSRDSVLTNVKTLQSLPSGGTNCSSVLKALNGIGSNDIAAVIYVSDNQSWMDNNGSMQMTSTMSEWKTFKTRNRNAKMVCIDIQPYGNTMAKESSDVLNVGGFSDSVFVAVENFLNEGLTGGNWVDIIKSS